MRTRPARAAGPRRRGATRSRPQQTSWPNTAAHAPTSTPGWSAQPPLTFAEEVTAHGGPMKNCSSIWFSAICSSAPSPNPPQSLRRRAERRNASVRRHQLLGLPRRSPRLQQEKDGPEAGQNRHSHQPQTGTGEPQVTVTVDATPRQVGSFLRAVDDTQRRVRLCHKAFRVPRIAANPPADHGQHMSPLALFSQRFEGRT